jgi:lysophospholipase L1-like esterase
VIVEAEPSISPGFVLDTLGINGAKFSTILAWDEAAWAAELGRRDPDLVILQYGTNEASDVNVKPSVFGGHVAKVVARVRRVKPDVDCLVLGPTDRADREDQMPRLRDALRDAARSAGCGFWDTYAVMGGRDSIQTWQTDVPPRAARDGTHLTPKGYRDLGERLFADLMKGYTP